MPNGISLFLLNWRTKRLELKYHQKKYKEEIQKREAGKQEGLLSKPKKKLGLASSVKYVDESNSGKENFKEESDDEEEEKHQKVVTREQSKEDANSITSKKEALGKGATGDGN